MKIDKIILVILAVVVVMQIGLIANYFKVCDEEVIKYPNEVFKETEFGGCYNLTFFETASCLNDYVKTIYKFKSQEDSRNMTLKELIDEGGDCRNWAMLYQDLANQRGVNATTKRIYEKGGIAHRVAFVYADEGYCMIDQNRLFCVEMK